MYVTDQKSNAAGNEHWLDIHNWRRCPCLKNQRRRILGPKPNPDSREKKPESILDLSPDSESITQSSPLRFLNRSRFGSSINLDSIPEYNAIRFPIQAQANRASPPLNFCCIPVEPAVAPLLHLCCTLWRPSWWVRSWGSATCSATWYCHCNLAWPLRTTGWDSHRFGSMYAPLRVPQPIDDISLFSLSSFRRQPKKFWENAPACCDFWPPNHHFGLALLSAVNRRFVVPCTKEISLKVLIPSSFLQALVM
jgi:hypothetical protein